MKETVQDGRWSKATLEGLEEGDQQSVAVSLNPKSGPQQRRIKRSRSVPSRNNDGDFCFTSSQSLRQYITFERHFNIKSLSPDLQQLYQDLEAERNEEYALACIFLIRTAVELHRAWHMSLLTSKILEQIRDCFQLQMTWTLGVIKLRFTMNNGRFQIKRKIPYDYDSEFQDLYTKVAVALIERHITLHQALIFQSEIKQGQHTAASGLFFRDFPGRLLLYPLEAATCAVIFFGGDWSDAGVAALTGLAAGLMEYVLTRCIGGQANVLVDVLVGFSTGIIVGLFYRFDGQQYCLSAIFMGTLYWFFYGTAFVIGFLEIIAGELETGVTRFIAVSVKTFVLSIGSAYGMKVSLANPFQTWIEQEQNQCGTIDLGTKWWRIPLYLLCSASALGQYRFPIANYWRGLIVQLVGYEVQYRLFATFALSHERDFLDTATSNLVGATAAVVTAASLSYIVERFGKYYSKKLLHRRDADQQDEQFPLLGKFMFNLTACYIRLTNFLGIGRRSDLAFMKMEQRLRAQTAELKDPQHSRQEIKLSNKEETILVEAIVGAETLNVWALLMPTVYQLVPGSLIARLWFNAVFPPPPIEMNEVIAGTALQYTVVRPNPAEDVFYNLTVVSTSLALGLVLGFALFRMCSHLLVLVCCQWSCCLLKREKTEEEKRLKEAKKERKRILQILMVPHPGDDPQSDDEKDPVLYIDVEDNKLERPAMPPRNQSLPNMDKS